MDSVVHGARLLLGLGMVAAGSTLAAPAGLHLAAILAQPGAPAVASPAPLHADWAGDRSAAHLDSMSPVHVPPMAGCQRLEYVPPPVPPQPLPPPPIDLAVAGPDLAAGYRPTLQSPPPPLLDGQSPPPLAVGWTARQPEPWTGAAGLPTPPPVVDQPGIYIVRDGDDLTGIATRFYGHPAAAAAIWQANRGLLRDPGILPIGAALVLPPRAAVAALGRPTDQALIEPAIAGQQAGSAQGNAVSRPASWLTDR